MNILEEIAEKTKKRVEERKQQISLEDMKQAALQKEPDTGFPFEKALRSDSLSFICEVKKASPSKGLIAPYFPYVRIAKDYEKGGASALSVLTEPYYFQGDNSYLTEIKKEVVLPIIRKDFTVDEYMIYEAKVIGADAILLICAILTDEELKRFHELATSLGLTALVEAHDAEEVERAVKIGAKVIGVNNRDLKTFTVDIHNSIRYRQMVDDDIVFVSESGIRDRADIEMLEENKVDAVLIGETLMRAENTVKALQQLRGLDAAEA